MGLDTVELVMAIEDEFSIQILDTDAEAMMTVGQVYEYILAKRGIKRQSLCLNAVTFYRLRRVLSKLSNRERHTIRPGTRLEAFAIGHKRREWWAELASKLNLALPALRRPGWCEPAAVCILTGSAIALTLAIIGLQPQWVVFVVGIMALFVSLYIVEPIIATIDPGLATCFPGGLETVGQLAQTLVWQDYDALAAVNGISRQPMDDYDIWCRLQTIICNEIGATPDQIHWDTMFVNDLGCG